MDRPLDKLSSFTKAWISRGIEKHYRPGSSMEATGDYIKLLPLELILNDTKDLLHYISRDIMEINNDFSDNTLISDYALAWRGRICAYEECLEIVRSGLLLAISLCDKMISLDEDARSSHGDKTKSPQEQELQREKFSFLKEDLGKVVTLSHDQNNSLKTLNKKLLAHVSMISMREQIFEARSVTNLTELAFFFIPLSFVTAIFSMQIKVGCTLYPPRPLCVLTSMNIPGATTGPFHFSLDNHLLGGFAGRLHFPLWYT